MNGATKQKRQKMHDNSYHAHEINCHVDIDWSRSNT